MFRVGGGTLGVCITNICLSTHLQHCPHRQTSVYIWYVSLFVYMCVCLFVCMPACPPACLPTGLFVCLSNCACLVLYLYISSSTHFDVHSISEWCRCSVKYTRKLLAWFLGFHYWNNRNSVINNMMSSDLYSRLYFQVLAYLAPWLPIPSHHGRVISRHRGMAGAVISSETSCDKCRPRNKKQMERNHDDLCGMDGERHPRVVYWRWATRRSDR